GLYKISSAPASRARSARSPTLQEVVQAVLMTTGMLRVDTFLFKRAVASSPFISGKLRSIMIRSGCKLEALSMASRPVLASRTSWPKPLIKPPRVSRQAWLLSTINIFFALFPMSEVRSTRDASQGTGRCLGVSWAGETILRYIELKYPGSIAICSQVKISGYQLIFMCVLGATITSDDIVILAVV